MKDGADASQNASAAAPNQSPSGSDDADWTLLENAGGKPSAPSQNPQEGMLRAWFAGLEVDSFNV